MLDVCRSDFGALGLVCCAQCKLREKSHASQAPDVRWGYLQSAGKSSKGRGLQQVKEPPRGCQRLEDPAP